MMRPYKDSPNASFERLVRSAVRKAPLTRAERDITLLIVNLWFYHKASTGIIFPSRAQLARRARVSIKTVSRTLGMLKAAGVLKAIRYEYGGRLATRYKLRFTPLLLLCGCDLPRHMEGELVPILRHLQDENVPVSEAKMSRLKTGSKCPTILKGRSDAFAAGSSDADAAEDSDQQSDDGEAPF